MECVYLIRALMGTSWQPSLVLGQETQKGLVRSSLPFKFSILPRTFNTAMPSDVTSTEKVITKRSIFDAQKLVSLELTLPVQSYKR